MVGGDRSIFSFELNFFQIGAGRCYQVGARVLVMCQMVVIAHCNSCDLAACVAGESAYLLPSSFYVPILIDFAGRSGASLAFFSN